MSVRRLTQNELATFLLGLAFRRALGRAQPRDPDIIHGLPGIARIVVAELSPDELLLVESSMGWDIKQCAQKRAIFTAASKASEAASLLGLLAGS